MASITFDLLGIIWAGAFIGGLAAGGAGFAFAVAASAIWLHALDPLRTTMLVVACGTFLHMALIWPMRQTISVRRLSPFVIGGLIGIPLGLSILLRTDPQALRKGLGLLLAGYGAYALAAPRLPEIKGGGAVADAVIGFCGGILGGLGGYSGVLPTIWTQLRGWPKDIARAVYQPFILITQIATLTLVGMVTFDPLAWLLVGVSVPALFFGAWLGWRAYERLDERRFRQVLAALIAFSGATLMV